MSASASDVSTAAATSLRPMRGRHVTFPAASANRRAPPHPASLSFAEPRPVGASPPPGVPPLLLPPATGVAAPIRPWPRASIGALPADPRRLPRPAPSPRRPAFPAAGSPPSPASKLAGAASSPDRVGVDEIHPSRDPNAPSRDPDPSVPLRLVPR
nr:vegetative cell wall protein gp1-like [Aegilops tauschii subsp. strangulata]